MPGNIFEFDDNDQKKNDPEWNEVKRIARFMLFVGIAILAVKGLSLIF